MELDLDKHLGVEKHLDGEMDTDLETELEQERVLCLCLATKQKLERK